MDLFTMFKHKFEESDGASPTADKLFEAGKVFMP